MEKTIHAIAARIREMGQKRENLANTLQQTDKLNISKFAHPIKPQKLDKIKICGVDGGFLKKEYHGAGLILRRAVAACFDYKNNHLEKVAYWPSRKPIPEPIVVGPEFSEQDFSTLANLKRTELEISTALGAIKEFRPKILLLDGSIVLYPSNVPEKSSPIYSTYQGVVKLLRKLYEKCNRGKILLAGAVEDSRGKRYCNLVLESAIPALLKSKASKKLKDKIKTNKSVLHNTTDTLFIYYLLNTGQRTASMRYSEADIPSLKALGEWKKAIHALYIKAVEFDRPLRIDFLAGKKAEDVADKVASVIWAISKQNRIYAYPSVLIEADARAKLAEHEIDIFKASLIEKLGRNPSLFELRRELRPF